MNEQESYQLKNEIIDILHDPDPVAVVVTGQAGVWRVMCKAKVRWNTEGPSENDFCIFSDGVGCPRGFTKSYTKL